MTAVRTDKRRGYRLEWDQPGRAVTRTGREVQSVAPWLIAAIAAHPGRGNADLARLLGVQQCTIVAARQGSHP